MYSLIVSASLNSISVTAATANRFLKPLAIEWGADATVGHPIARETQARLTTPSMKRLRRSSSVMSRMRGSNFVSSSQQFHFVKDFNGSLGNLGWDVKSLEERGLLRTHTSVLGSNHDRNGSNGASLSRGSNLVVQDDLTDLSEIFLGEHKSNISLDVGKQFLKCWVVLKMSTDGFAHHCVLAHKHLSMATKSYTDLLHLLGAHIINSYHEASWVLIQKSNEL